LAKGSVDKAKKDFMVAIERNPRNLANYMALEIQYKREEDWEQAKKICERARQVDPASPQLALELSNLYLEHGGDVNLAASLAQSAKQRMPNSAAVADTLGWAYYKLKSYDLAVEQFRDCLRIEPANASCSYHLGITYMDSSRPELAARSLRKSLQDDPRSRYGQEIRGALTKLSR
jgi:tetratricopeptide (TPR) repeat protein